MEIDEVIFVESGSQDIPDEKDQEAEEVVMTAQEEEDADGSVVDLGEGDPLAGGWWCKRDRQESRGEYIKSGKTYSALLRPDGAIPLSFYHKCMEARPDVRQLVGALKHMWRIHAASDKTLQLPLTWPHGRPPQNPRRK
jgi:hypothetical protein